MVSNQFLVSSFFNPTTKMNSVLVLLCVLPLMLATPPVWNEGKCGKSKYPDAGDYFLPAPSIVGGVEARPHEFPWQISFQTTKNFHVCGGSVINKKWILTAAHCLKGKVIKNYMVVTGLHKKITGSNATTVESFELEEFVIHEKYNGNTFNNDIGLIKVKGEIKLDENVSPVCAPESKDQFADLKAAVSGWGSLASGSSKPVDALRYTTLNITTNEYCSKIYNEPSMPKITQDMICASDNQKNIERDSCQGDSGGPLVLKDSDGTFRLVGIVSWGKGCASQYPGVYTRVNYFEDWILKKIKN